MDITLEKNISNDSIAFFSYSVKLNFDDFHFLKFAYDERETQQFKNCPEFQNLHGQFLPQPNRETKVFKLFFFVHEHVKSTVRHETLRLNQINFLCIQFEPNEMEGRS